MASVLMGWGGYVAVKFLIRLANIGLFTLLGWRLSLVLLTDGESNQSLLIWKIALIVSSATIGGLLGPFVTFTFLKWMSRKINSIPSNTIIFGTVGMILGLVVASLVSIPFFQLEGWTNWLIPLIVSGILGITGLVLGIQRSQDFRGINTFSKRENRFTAHINGDILVDTSAIIDGRIADLTNTGFVGGTLIIPRFVLDELRHIADSSDTLRRTRGRRGLEVLSKIRNEGILSVQFLEIPLPNNIEVDAELVRLAKSMKAYIMTTDFNLNRIAEIQGIPVLNVNELANALKPVVLPGENMAVNIVQEGKEAEQGVGFLDDGTMVVIDGGRRFINTVQTVTITRVLQTAAGRIIFAQS
ncbi:PIN domain nuclease [SAR202 cluster bacterium AC-409-J13_OGT_754m]|nr:PIN domain nuclease [SAR202 cluster bacterium AC-409-J13_OGT_754m]